MTFQEDERRRLSLVQALLELKIPLDEARSQLSTITWDYEGDGVELKASYVVNVLERYLQGELSSQEIELWANQIEGRDDVWFEVCSAHEIEEVLYELANPVLTQPLSFGRAAELLETLRDPG